MTKRSKILLYQDYVNGTAGLDNNGVLHRRLCLTYGHENVRFCDSDDILDGVLNNSVFLFVIPGGADLYYCERLNGEGNSKIRAYVEQGGNYLGICGGAYYAAGELDWAKGDIAGPRELNFFDGKAIGPIYEFLQDNDISKSWQNIVDVNINGEIYPALYYGGPIFDQPGFATYSNGQTAIIKSNIGKGTVILSSPHIEYRPEDLAKATYKNQNSSYDWMQNNLEKFEKRYHSERDIWSRVLKEFE